MKDRKRRSGLSRRDFLKLSAGAVAGGAIPKLIWLGNGLAAVPASGGYLLVDTRKCQGCMTCMLACSLAHWRVLWYMKEGRISRCPEFKSSRIPSEDSRMI
jgi:anaerobic selenocysteine-containing dehydrogenase